MSGPYTFIGAGSSIGYGTSSGGSFTLIANLISVSGGGGERTMVETTGLSSANETSQPGLIKPSDVTVEVYYDPADSTHNAIHSAWVNGTLTWFQEVFPTATQEPSVAANVVYSGYVKTWDQEEVSANETIKVSFAIEVQTIPVITHV